MAEIGSFFLVGCDPSRVLSFGVLGSVCVCVCVFFFFFLFCRDPCLKEEVGIAEIGGDWWVSWWRLVGFWVWIGAMCGASSIAPMVGFWFGLN